jgi:hypothetical protein
MAYPTRTDESLSHNGRVRPFSPGSAKPLKLRLRFSNPHRPASSSCGKMALARASETAGETVGYDSYGGSGGGVYGIVIAAVDSRYGD